MTSPPGPPPSYQPYPQQGYPYGQYGPQYGQPPSPYPSKPSTNGFAIASLILGIIGGVLLSVIFGIIALNQTKGGRQGGRGMAIAGLVLSGVWTLGFIALMVLGIFLARWDSVRATDIKTGDCIKESPADGATVSRLSRVSCDEPHEGEVYAMIRVSGDTFPGQPAMRREYQPGVCRRWSRTRPMRPMIRASTTSSCIPARRPGTAGTATWPASLSRRTSPPALSKSDLTAPVLFTEAFRRNRYPKVP